MRYLRKKKYVVVCPRALSWVPCYLLYTCINEINHSSELISFILFADDTNLLMSNKDPNTLMIQMNEELEKISTWLVLNKLSLNLTKTHFIFFKSSRKKLKIKDKIISQVRHTEFLGVKIDEHLNWKEHINNIGDKISKFTGLLCKARHYVTRPLLKSIYYALIYPYIFYGNVVWANTYQSHLDKVYKLQKENSANNDILGF